LDLPTKNKYGQITDFVNIGDNCELPLLDFS
jgi:hypothetical protein